MWCAREPGKQMAESNHHLEVAGHSVDVDKMTKSLESGNTTMLESVLGKTHTIAERKSILNTVQQVNEEHRTANPNMHIPVLEFAPHAEADKEVLELLTGSKDQGSTILYEEFDYPKDCGNT